MRKRPVATTEASSCTACVRSGLTQRELSELAGIGQGTIWELETGRRGAYPRTVRRLAKALETEVADLVGE